MVHATTHKFKESWWAKARGNRFAFIEAPRGYEIDDVHQSALGGDLVFISIRKRRK